MTSKSRMQELLVGASLLALPLLPGCDGSSSPTQPPPPGDGTVVVVEGTVVGMFDPTRSFAGTEVDLAVAAGALGGTVDSGNRFRIDGVAPGDWVATLTGASHLQRRLTLRVRAGGTNRFEPIELAERQSFNLAAFDEIYRSRSFPLGNLSNASSRWRDSPRFAFVETHFDDLGAEGMALRQRIRDFIRDRLPELSLGVLAGAQFAARGPIETPGRLCRSDSPVADLEVVVDAVEAFTGPSGERLGGATSVCPVAGNELVRGILTFAPIAGPAVIAHEFGHLLGAQHLNSARGSSIMRLPLTETDFTPMDRRHLEYLFRRPPGTRSPDDTSHLGALEGQVFQAAGASGAIAPAPDDEGPPRTPPSRDRRRAERGADGPRS